jgi:hypothetical protein
MALCWVSCGEASTTKDTKITKKNNLSTKREAENQKKFKAFVYFALFVVNQKVLHH